MRITKKYAGNNCIGKQIFQPTDDTFHIKDITSIEFEELRVLETSFYKRIYLQSTFYKYVCTYPV